jgi:hypothetical protein
MRLAMPLRMTAQPALADVFDDISDIYTTTTAFEAARVVARVLGATLRASDASVYIYDINEHVFRLVASSSADAAVTAMAADVVATAEQLTRTVFKGGRLRAAIAVHRRERAALSDGERHVLDYVADRFADALP